MSRPGAWLCDAVFVTFQDPLHLQDALRHYSKPRKLFINDLLYRIQMVDESFLVHYTPSSVLTSAKHSPERPNSPPQHISGPASARTSSSSLRTLTPIPHVPSYVDPGATPPTTVLGKRKTPDEGKSNSKLIFDDAELIETKLPPILPTSPSKSPPRSRLPPTSPRADRARSAEVKVSPTPDPLLVAEVASLKEKLLSTQARLEEKSDESLAHKLLSSSRLQLLEDQIHRTKLKEKRRKLERTYDDLSRSYDEELDRRKDTEALLKRLNRNLKARAAAAADAVNVTREARSKAPPPVPHLLEIEVELESLRARTRAADQKRLEVSDQRREVEDTISHVDNELGVLRAQEARMDRLGRISTNIDSIASTPRLATARSLLCDST